MNDRRLKIALAVSMLLNLFALGAAGGAAAMWSRLKSEPVGAAPHRRAIRTAGDALPPADRERFRAVMRTVAQAARPIRQEAQQSRRQAATLFVQPSFNAAAANAALARARSADFALRTRLETTVVEFAAGLPGAERAVLAQGLSRGPLRQPRR